MVYPFTTTNNLELKTVGGKAKALIETTNNSFPVPKGIVLTVDFFREWLDFIKESPLWKDVISTPTKNNCDALKTLADSLEFTSHQIESMTTQLQALEGNIFAIRSSSPEEDLEGTSFAGMYDTYLGIKRQDIDKYVKKTFSSCFDYRVMEYKTQNNIPLVHTAIAVIIQKQIQSEISGVGFSLNPLNNAYDEVYINASFGLGEAIVSGLVTPDTYVVDYTTGELVHKKINPKVSGIWLQDDGGVYTKENSEPEKQSLDIIQIKELSKLIKMCEKYYDKPMDIEWAYEDNKLYLLQARPITTYIPLYPELCTKPGENKLLYLDILAMTQGFSDPLSVLGTEIWANIMYISGGKMFDCSPEGTSPVIYGRQFFNIFYLYRAFGKTLGNSYIYGHDVNVKKLMDTINSKEFRISHYPRCNKGTKWNMCKMSLRFMGPTMGALLGDHDKQIDKYMSLFNDTLQKAKQYNSKEDFRHTVDCAVQDITKIIFASGMLMAGVLASNKINKMFKKYNVNSELAALGMDLKGNPTSEMGHIMFDLASSEEFINTHSYEEFTHKLQNKIYSTKFMDTYDRFIIKHGCRGFKEIDIASPRGDDSLEELFTRLKDINIEDSQITKVKDKKNKAFQKLYSLAKEGGFQKKFEKQVKIYQATFGYREYLKYSTVSFISILRKIALEIGQTLVDGNRLECASQIFDLSINDISTAQKDRTFDVHNRRLDNLAPYKKVAHVKQWPLLMDSRGKIYKPKIQLKDGDFVGSSIAPGKVIGKAKILNTPYEKPIQPGEIIVTHSTEPSWTPIFINASGVVMEVGGPLQHGGIIAREYGIPCISGLVGITDLINDGDIIEVDGNNGILRILEPTSNL